MRLDERAGVQCEGDNPMRHTRSTPREGFFALHAFECKPCGIGLVQSMDEPPVSSDRS